MNYNNACQFLHSTTGVIYDRERVHPFMTSTGRGGAQADAYGRRGSAPSGRPHRKLEPTDIILSFSHVKKLAFFGPEFRLSGKFSSI